jgi:hypothetical protein
MSPRPRTAYRYPRVVGRSTALARPSRRISTPAPRLVKRVRTSVIAQAIRKRFKDDEIEDIVFVITYEAETPAWPD